MDRSQALEQFFQGALDAFQKVENPAHRRAKLGPLTLDLHISPSLQSRDWTSPLALKGSEEEPTATIYAWDESLGSTKFPPPPWGANYVYTHRGDIKGFQSERIEAAFNWDSKLLCLWDKERRIGIYWTPNLKTLPSYEWAAPLRTLLHWVGLSHGMQLTHAAAVGREGRGVLLAGRGGSGKSTTSLACWNAGWQFVSDDYCWVGFEPTPRAHSVYRTAKLFPDQPVDLPRWQHEEQLSAEKNVFNLDNLGGERLVPYLDMEALALPLPREGDKPELREASRRDSLAALSLTTMAQLAGAGPKSMMMMRRLTEELPCYHLDLCHPVSAVPAVLERLLPS